MTKTLPWFRFYTEALDNNKVQSLPGDLFKAWVNVLCVARRYNGALPPLADTAFALRMSEEACAELFATLKSRRLLDEEDGRLVPHDFAERQYISDSSTTRVQKFRKRHKKQKPKRKGNVSETPPEQSRTEQNRAEQKQSEGEAPPLPVAHAIPQGFKPSDDAMQRAKALGLTGADLAKMAVRFFSHHRENGRLSSDWNERFMSWAADEAKKLGRSPPKPAAAVVASIPDDERMRPVRDALLKMVEPDVYESWFAKLSLHAWEGKRVTFHLPTRFFCTQFQNNQYGDRLRAAFDAAYPGQVEIIDYLIAPQRRSA